MTKEALKKEIKEDIIAFMVSEYHLIPKKINLDRIGKHEFMDLVVRYVCEKTGVLPEQIKSKDSHRPFVEARMLINNIAKKSLGELISLEFIGSHLNKNHATLLHYKKIMGNLMETDKVKKRTFDKIISEFDKQYGEYIEKLKNSHKN